MQRGPAFRDQNGYAESGKIEDPPSSIYENVRTEPEREILDCRVHGTSTERAVCRAARNCAQYNPDKSQARSWLLIQKTRHCSQESSSLGEHPQLS